MRFTKGNLWPPHFFKFDEELEEIDTFFLMYTHLHAHEFTCIYLFMLFDVAIDRKAVKYYNSKVLTTWVAKFHSLIIVFNFFSLFLEMNKVAHETKNI